MGNAGQMKYHIDTAQQRAIEVGTAQIVSESGPAVSQSAPRTTQRRHSMPAPGQLPAQLASDKTAGTGDEAVHWPVTTGLYWHAGAGEQGGRAGLAQGRHTATDRART